MARAEAAVMITTILLLVASPFAPVAPSADSAQVSCPTVGGCIVWCIGYARSGGEMPGHCCDGMRYLLGSVAVTVRERQQACECLKAIMGVIPGLKMGLVAGIPRLCQIHLDFPINKELNCSQVK